jgi:hypothetical protein
MRRLFIVLFSATTLVGATAPSASAGGPCLGEAMKDPDQRAFVVGVIRNDPGSANTLGNVARDCP